MQIMTVRRVILITCLILAAFSLVVALLYTPPASGSGTTPSAREQAAEAPYTVRSYQGYVAVYSGSEEEPGEITGIRVSLLPLQDQLDLAQGIPLYSETELSALLEDYGA